MSCYTRNLINTWYHWVAHVLIWIYMLGIYIGNIFFTHVHANTWYVCCFNFFLFFSRFFTFSLFLDSFFMSFHAITCFYIILYTKICHADIYFFSKIMFFKKKKFYFFLLFMRFFMSRHVTSCRDRVKKKIFKKAWAILFLHIK